MFCAVRHYGNGAAIILLAIVLQIQYHWSKTRLDQSGQEIARVVHRNGLPVERVTVYEPERLRFFETFVVKFRLFLVWREEPDRENEKR